MKLWQKKRSRQIALEYIEEEREEAEEIEDEYWRKEQNYKREKQDYQNRIDRTQVEYVNSIEDSVIAEFQRHEETLERSRRDSRLNAILAKLRYMKDRYCMMYLNYIFVLSDNFHFLTN